MRINVATWNLQGFGNHPVKRAAVDMLLQNADVVMLQEAGSLSQQNQYGGYPCVGADGVATDGYGNNRVSLAIISKDPVDASGFEAAESRGLLWASVGGVLYGCWHEKRGHGGLGFCLGALMARGVLAQGTPCVIGGDFNDVSADAIRWGTNRGGFIALHSSSYNLAYSLFATHRSGRNLDRVFISDALDMVHQWTFPVEASDHNPVFATIVDRPGELTRWERLKRTVWNRQ